MNSGHYAKQSVKKIENVEKPVKLLYCQNALCGVRNTKILGKYCSFMCADCDAGVLSEKEWVEMHYQFWSNSNIPYEDSGV